MIDIFKKERLIETDESGVRKKFVKNGYKHDKEKNQYILIHSNTEVPQNKDRGTNSKIIRLGNHSKNTLQAPNKEYPDSNTLVVPKEKTERLLKLMD